MLYSTSTKYAIILLVELAARKVVGPVGASDLSRTTRLPRHFLSKVAQNLVKSGFLRSSKGRKGGYELARAPSRITIADVVRAVDGPDALRKCIFGLFPCAGERHCPLHPTWNPLRRQIAKFLKHTTISQLARSIVSLPMKPSWAEGDEEETADCGASEGSFYRVEACVCAL